jgi:hypothetical protein
MSEPRGEGAGKRRPKDGDLEPILELIWEGRSLRSACAELGLHVPSTSDWLHEDEGRREQYGRAREGRAEYLQEDSLTVNRAAALGIMVGDNSVDASGAKGYLEAVKFAIGRMAPKTIPPTRIDLTSRTRQMTDEEIAAEIAALEGAAPGGD